MMPKTMWAVGTDNGDFDWQAIDAPDREKAIQQYALTYDLIKCEFIELPNRQGPCILPCEVCGAKKFQEEPRDNIDACRVPMWDNKPKIKAMHWIKAGFGCMCEECGYECFPETGAIIFRGVVYCEDCRDRRPWIRRIK